MLKHTGVTSPRVFAPPGGCEQWVKYGFLEVYSFRKTINCCYRSVAVEQRNLKMCALWGLLKWFKTKKVFFVLIYCQRVFLRLNAELNLITVKWSDPILRPDVLPSIVTESVSFKLCNVSSTFHLEKQWEEVWKRSDPKTTYTNQLTHLLLFFRLDGESCSPTPETSLLCAPQSWAELPGSAPNSANAASKCSPCPLTVWRITAAGARCWLQANSHPHIWAASLEKKK